MNNEIASKGDAANMEDDAELEGTANGPIEIASMRAGETVLHPQDPSPMGNPKITVES